MTKGLGFCISLSVWHWTCKGKQEVTAFDLFQRSKKAVIVRMLLGTMGAFACAMLESFKDAKQPLHFIKTMVTSGASANNLKIVVMEPGYWQWYNQRFSPLWPSCCQEMNRENWSQRSRKTMHLSSMPFFAPKIHSCPIWYWNNLSLSQALVAGVCPLFQFRQQLIPISWLLARISYSVPTWRNRILSHEHQRTSLILCWDSDLFESWDVPNGIVNITTNHHQMLDTDPQPCHLMAVHHGQALPWLAWSAISIIYHYHYNMSINHWPRLASYLSIIAHYISYY